LPNLTFLLDFVVIKISQSNNSLAPEELPRDRRVGLDQLQLDMYNLPVKTAPGFRVEGRVPIVYSDQYNVSLSLPEESHPFDFDKRGAAFRLLCKALSTNSAECFCPELPLPADLEKIHSSRHLSRLQDPHTLAQVMQIPALAKLTQAELEAGLLMPMKLATGGTLLAAQLAQKHGWAINLSGGFHHATRDRAEGFCFFADIPLAVNAMLLDGLVRRVLIIDLDAHQGNGLARMLHTHPGVAILDVYNEDIYPRDKFAASLIRYNSPLPSTTSEERYLEVVQRLVSQAIGDVKPDMIFYNAGVDIYRGDKLGKMQISEKSLFKRDELVFREAFQSGTKIAMTLAGGYAKSSDNPLSLSSAQLIAQSITGLVTNLMVAGD